MEIGKLQVRFHPHAVWSSLARTDSHGFLAPCSKMDIEVETAVEVDKVSRRESRKSNEQQKRHHQVEVLHLFRCSTHTTLSHTTDPRSSLAHNFLIRTSFTQSVLGHLHATHTRTFLTHNLLTHNLLTSNSLTRNSLIRTSFTQSVFHHLHRTHTYFFTYIT